MNEVIHAPAISSDEAIRRLRDWQARAVPLGLHYARAGGYTSLFLRGCISRVRNDLAEVRGDTGVFFFPLRQAEFRYGPLQIYDVAGAPPREIIALQVMTRTADWVILSEAADLPAEGIRLLPQGPQ